MLWVGVPVILLMSRIATLTPCPLPAVLKSPVSLLRGGFLEMSPSQPPQSQPTQKLSRTSYVYVIFFFPFCFWLPQGTWNSQARDHSQASVSVSTTAIAMLDPLTHRAGPGFEPVSWCCRDAADPIVPQQELLFILFLTNTLLYVSKANRLT